MEEVGSSSLLSPTIKKGRSSVSLDLPFFMVGFYENSLRGNLLPTSVNLLQQILAVNIKVKNLLARIFNLQYS